MSSEARRTITVALALVVSAAASVPVSAQTVDEHRTRVDRLADRLEALRTQVLSAESQVPLDTVATGRIHVVALPDRRTFTQDVARLVWDSLRITLRADTSLVTDLYVYLHDARAPRLSVGDLRSHFIEEAATTEVVAGQLVGMAMSDLWAGADADLRGWLGTVWSFDSLSSVPAEVVYRELVIAPWQVTDACRRGDLASCRRVLGLESTEDSVSYWYTPEEQRRVVEQFDRYSPALWLRTMPAFQACVGGTDAACTELLNEHFYLIRAPLSASARETLLRLALQYGGEGALGRLVGSEGLRLDERLGRAAGIAADTLLVRWRERILAAAPEPTILTRRSGWFAFLWVVALVVLSARSTRWRTD
jgi:hypothetical protein